MKLNCGSGNIRIADSQAEFRANTGSGDVAGRKKTTNYFVLIAAIIFGTLLVAPAQEKDKHKDKHKEHKEKNKESKEKHKDHKEKDKKGRRI